MYLGKKGKTGDRTYLNPRSWRGCVAKMFEVTFHNGDYGFRPKQVLLTSFFGKGHPNVRGLLLKRLVRDTVI